MSTRDFVKSTGRDKYWEALAGELREIQDENGMLKSELHRRAECALCEVDDTDPVFIKEGFRFVKCRRCGLVYVNPQADAEKLQAWYRRCRSNDIWTEVLLSQAENEYDAEKFSAICDDLERLLGKKGRVLDIGCSIGNFLRIARDRGWETVGLELNEKAVRHATQKLGLDVRPALLSGAGFEREFFDVITLWEVLEHVPEPAVILKECAAYLRPGGILGILVPNRDALSAMIMHEHCPCFGGRNHLWHFSREVLARLLSKTGFSPLMEETRTHLSQINEILSHLSYRNPYFSSPDEHDFTLPDEVRKKLEKFIFDNHLGYKLLMYARRG